MNGREMTRETSANQRNAHGRWTIEQDKAAKGSLSKNSYDG